MAKVGDRVVALWHANGKEVWIFGRGEYIGDTVPGEEAAGFMADALRDMGRANPTIKLDSGQVVYGCECWWGPEEQFESYYKGKTVREANIDVIREQSRKMED